MSLIANGVHKVNIKADLTRDDFGRIRKMVYDYCGINLHDGKQALVRGRLMKRLRMLQMQSFADYLDYVDSDSSNKEFLLLIDILTTNKTSFFRESSHFDFLRDEVIPKLGDGPVKWWSAGCSSGEEPITMAVTLLEELNMVRNPLVKLLATDLSTEVLKVAKEGIYSEDKLEGMPKYMLHKYFRKQAGEKVLYRVQPNVQKMITYGRLNLLGEWPMKGPFQIIMCRNVMIYFDKITQQNLVRRFYDMLEPGGYLFVGHSESVTNKEIGFTTVQPAAYQKTGV